MADHRPRRPRTPRIQAALADSAGTRVGGVPCVAGGEGCRSARRRCRWRGCMMHRRGLLADRVSRLAATFPARAARPRWVRRSWFVAVEALFFCVASAVQRQTNCRTRLPLLSARSVDPTRALPTRDCGAIRYPLASPCLQGDRIAKSGAGVCEPASACARRSGRESLTRALRRCRPARNPHTSGGPATDRGGGPSAWLSRPERQAQNQAP
jgi:hypothetical protein